MTEKQIKIYKYIRDYKIVYGEEPEINTICMQFNQPKGNIKTLLYKIRNRGFIEIERGNIKIIK